MYYLQSDDQNKIVFIHNMPLDAVYGMNKTKEELLSTGYLVDSIPTPEDRVNEVPILYIQPESMTLYYLYEPTIPVEVPIVEITNSDIAATQTVIMEVLATMYEGLIMTGTIE